MEEEGGAHNAQRNIWFASYGGTASGASGGTAGTSPSPDTLRLCRYGDLDRPDPRRVRAARWCSNLQNRRSSRSAKSATQRREQPLLFRGPVCPPIEQSGRGKHSLEPSSRGNVVPILGGTPTEQRHIRGRFEQQPHRGGHRPQ